MRALLPLLFALLLLSPLAAAEVRPPGLADFDAKTLRGTPGYFRVGRTTTGQWWLLAPDDTAFFSKGVVGVNRAGTPGGRRAQRGPYAEAVDRKFGAGDPAPFVQDVLRRVRAWHLNTLGAWTTAEFFDQGVPYTEVVEFRYDAPAMIKAGSVDLPDVFDARWPAACARKAAEICAPRRGSRQLIGYFTDNEFGWGQPNAEDLFAQITKETKARREHPSLLQVCLALEPTMAAHAAAWDFVRAEHGAESTALAKAWDLPRADRAALAELVAAGTPLLSEGYLRDNEAFSRRFARRYFETTAAAIRAVDPNHLILGCRFGGPPGRAVLLECVAPQVDVLSANNYQDRFYERLETYYQVNAMPILVGEFSWASDYFTRLPLAAEPAGLTVRERMERKGRAALERAITHPGLVGYGWYRWVQGDPAKIPPYSYGLVYLNDDTAEEHTGPLSAINARAELIRAGAAQAP